MLFSTGPFYRQHCRETTEFVSHWLMQLNDVVFLVITALA